MVPHSLESCVGRGGLEPARRVHFGGIAGALFLGAYVLVRGEWRLALDPSFFAAVGVASALGAGLTTSMVTLAKRARRQEMAAIENLRALSEPE